jgi:hypothetical protein
LNPVPPAPQPPVTTPPAVPLARRLTRRTIDLVVIAFLIVVGLSIGQQLIDWWRTDPNSTLPDLSGLAVNDLDWNRTPVTLHFGNAPMSLERVPFHGDRKQLEEELTKIGQSIVNTMDGSVSAMDEAEKEWLAALNEAPPVFWDSTRGNVYRRFEPLPSFVATRFLEPDNQDAGNQAEPVTQRIVGWGLAFPSSPVDWTIYVFHPDSATPAEKSALPLLSLPEGGQNVTSLRGADGSRWQVIQGRGHVAGWVQHFENQVGTGTVVSRVVGDQTASLKYRRDQVVTDVQIRTEPDGRLTGVLWSAKEREPQ